MIHDLALERLKARARLGPLRFCLRTRVQDRPMRPDGGDRPVPTPYKTVSPGFARQFQRLAAQSLDRPPVARAPAWSAFVWL
ncbi:hypothetical protein [Tropicibacter sp. S64]|uniref:hypothetical protein n=1 Tax=Tropicibacter sp. S64 TaxID=3415122 RepID=UPI003C7D29B6